MFTRFSLPRESFIPKGAIKVADKLSDAVAYLYTGKSHGRPVAMMFCGKQAKPAQHFNYRSEQARENAVREFFTSRRQFLAFKATRKAQRTAFVHTVQVGDIYRTSWGYDQTNVEFFEVIEVRGKHAILREIASASEANGPSEKFVPQSGAFLSPRYEGDDQGLPIRRLIQDGHIKIDQVRNAWPWGKRVAGVVIGSACHRTASGWGH